MSLVQAELVLKHGAGRAQEPQAAVRMRTAAALLEAYHAWTGDKSMTPKAFGGKLAAE